MWHISLVLCIINCNEACTFSILQWVIVQELQFGLHTQAMQAGLPCARDVLKRSSISCDPVLQVRECLM